MIEKKKDRIDIGAGIQTDAAIAMLSQMYIIRTFEIMADQSYAMGKTHGTMHLSVGQEASAVGAISALLPDDLILSTHRGHGHCIAKGADVKKMVAEFFGKETGYCRGRGGSMHIADIEGGNLGANGVVAGGIPLSVGVGLSMKMQKNGRIILCFFGDGAVNTGAFHESLNMAAIYNLPIVFVCENNQYAMSFSAKISFPIDDISDRAEAYGMPGITVDGNDLIAVYSAVGEAVNRARNGDGPSFIVCETYRWMGHSRSDRNLYRTKEEINVWKEKDPIQLFRDRLIAAEILTEDEADLLQADAREIIEAGVKFAEESPEPSLDMIEDGVYAP